MPAAGLDAPPLPSAIWKLYEFSVKAAVSIMFPVIADRVSVLLLDSVSPAVQALLETPFVHVHEENKYPAFGFAYMVGVAPFAST